MIQSYVVTESEFDGNVLKLLLPDDLQAVTYFIEGNGKYGAESIANSLLMVKYRPVALVIDSDTTDQSSIEQQLSQLQASLAADSPHIPFKVLLAVPEIEEILFQDKALLERLVGKPISSKDWEEGKNHPKNWLINTWGINNYRNIGKHLGDADIKTLQQHHLVQELIAFLQESKYEPTH